ncbi:MAG: hypothetical protein M1828_001301 [Chrysothrix sp. TS-e1954]|nr:MAG: hypothetical protein M1828_001301 [Chrysothrix sp. TS-e1954]
MPRRAATSIASHTRLSRGLVKPATSLIHNVRRISSSPKCLATDDVDQQESPTAQVKVEAASESQSTSVSDATASADQVVDEGAMTRRLDSLASSNLSPGDSNAAKAIEESGFDPELKKTLLDRITSASPRTSYPQAFAEAEMPTSAGSGSRLIAASEPWAGTESIHDSTLRMLDDSHRKIRVPNRIPSPSGMQRAPRKVDTGRPSKAKTPSSGARLANARDRSSMYSYLRDESLSQKEREQLRSELKDRFSPSARPMPTSVQGLQSLANERIEDAIARGQFKNLARGSGKNVERDYAASSPFLDTTEYFMNKIIQKQEIVPPWIEKQQELGQAAARFRGGLRKSWRRHVARVVASWGGGLEVQMRRAEAYAAAELEVNPMAKTRRIDDAPMTEEAKPKVAPHMSQISLSGELSTTAASPTTSSKQATTANAPITTTTTTDPASPPPTASTLSTPASPQAPTTTPLTTTPATPPPSPPQSPTPFRDPTWLTLERPYHVASITALNALTRTYNLQAPSSARKPYTALDRELLACYADVAPSVAGEIRERALAPRAKVVGDAGGGKSGIGVAGLGGVGGFRGHTEGRGRGYGFRELWRDFWGRGEVGG